MTTPTATAPTRRSALDATHRGLTAPGATDPRLRWPMSYGDPDGEWHAVAAAIGLAEPGLYDKWVARGPGALATCRSMGLDARPGQVLPAAPGGISAWAIADDEVWLLTYGPDPGAPPLPPANAAAAVARLRAGGALVTDVSSGWSVLRLVGPRVRGPERLCARVRRVGQEPDLVVCDRPGADAARRCRRHLSPTRVQPDGPARGERSRSAHDPFVVQARFREADRLSNGMPLAIRVAVGHRPLEPWVRDAGRGEAAMRGVQCRAAGRRRGRRRRHARNRSPAGS